MSKTLSNGTLSLRFMQNAQRAKQQAQVELEQAKVKDEAEWEVSQEIRDAWGIGSSAASTPSSATYEASYIPFLFSTQADSAARPKGRRTFNAKGHEVKEQPNEMKQTEDQIPNGEGEHATPKRLTSISGFKVPLHSKPKNLSKGKTKTALEMIHEDARTGPSPHFQTVAETGFVKPAGVDGPSVVRTKAEKASPETSLKREREPTTNDASNVATNKKRRKKKGAIE